MGTDTNNNNDSSGNNNKSGNGNRNRNNKKTGNKKTSVSTNNKFKGKCKELEGIIFDANRYNQADEYIKAVAEIAEYIGRTYENGTDVQQTIESGVRLVLDKPKKPSVDAGTGKMDETDEYIWKKEIDYYIKRKSQLDSNLRKAYSLVWGQCSDVMREKIETLADYKDMKDNCDVLRLLASMKE